MRKYILSCLFLPLAFVFAANYLTNAAFEQDLSAGWTSYMASTTYDTIVRGTAYDPDGDYEVMTASHFGYLTKLYQTVDIPTVNDISFAIKAKLIGTDNNADALCWGGAAVIVAYLNSSGAVLGQTRICQFSAPCPWTSTPTMHLITVADTLWHNYSFTLAAELANLPGVTPSQVKKVQVCLFDTTAHTC